MLKKTFRAMVPIAALVLVAACSDTTGPGAPELAEVQEESEDGSREVKGNQVKERLPMDQQREDGT